MVYAITLSVEVEPTMVRKSRKCPNIDLLINPHRATAGYIRLLPAPVAASIVQKIFEMAAGGIGVTSIVRYLNELALPTPIHYANPNGLSGNYADGDGNGTTGL